MINRVHKNYYVEEHIDAETTKENTEDFKRTINSHRDTHKQNQEPLSLCLCLKTVWNNTIHCYTVIVNQKCYDSTERS